MMKLKHKFNPIYFVFSLIIGLVVGVTVFHINQSILWAFLITILVVFVLMLANNNNLMSSLIVVLVGLGIGFIILLVSHADNAWPAFMTILSFGATSMRNIGQVLMNATPIILTGLSVAFAYRTGLFNIGATGQYTFGAFTAILIGIVTGRTGNMEEIVWNIPGMIYVWRGYAFGAGDGTFFYLSPGLRIFVCIVAAALAGAIWGSIPGLLKAYRNVHEVITSIMTNYIGMFLVAHLINEHIFDQGRGTTLPIAPDSNLPSVGLQYIFTDGERASNVNLGIIIAIVIAIVVYIILEKTTFGYELKACGFNRDAAKYAGINEKKNIVTSMMICGALAGVGGALNFMNDIGRSLTATPILQQEGFTGISVAFLGLNHPIAIIFSGIFVAYIFDGGNRIQPLGFDLQIVGIVISVIIYFCAFVFLVKSFIEKGAMKFTKEDAEVKSRSPAIKVEPGEEAKEFLDEQQKQDSEFEPEPEQELRPDLVEEPEEGSE